MAPPDVVCLSHVRRAFALERPREVMRRFARDRHVFFVEEPVAAGTELRTVMRTVEPNVHVVSVELPAETSAEAIEVAHRRCIAALARDAERPLLWVYAPSALRAARDLDPSLLAYDCVADHAARSGARPEEARDEADLLARADLVFTAGTSLFEAKRARNVSTYPLPSSVDARHFAEAAPCSRRELGDLLAREPRVGFLGPIDDRVDLGLIDQLAPARPDVQLVLAGGLVGVTTWDLPNRPNVHWRGAREYAELPRHVASWDVAIIPFRTDAATRRTEPSGLLACLAAGKAVVSAARRGHDARRARARCDGRARRVRRRRRCGAPRGARPVITAMRTHAGAGLVARTSWDRTFHAMLRLVDEAALARAFATRRRDRESECECECECECDGRERSA